MKVGKKDVKKLEGNEERSKKGKAKVDLECGPAQLSLFSSFATPKVEALSVMAVSTT